MYSACCPFSSKQRAISLSLLWLIASVLSAIVYLEKYGYYDGYGDERNMKYLFLCVTFVNSFATITLVFGLFYDKWWSIWPWLLIEAFNLLVLTIFFTAAAMFEDVTFALNYLFIAIFSYIWYIIYLYMQELKKNTGMTDGTTIPYLKISNKKFKIISDTRIVMDDENPSLTPKYYEGDYTRIYSKGSSDEEETELFVKKPAYKEVPTIDIQLEDDDTLQAISIRYRCTIEELKRLNNIHKDNEIFAHRTIKVPSRLFSQPLAAIHTSGNNSPEKPTDFESVITKELLTKKLSSTLLHIPNISESSDFNNVIFNSNIVSSKPCDILNNVVNEIPVEEVRLLPQEQVLQEHIVSKMSCSGADADIHWIALIVCIIVVIVLIPLIYVLYIAEHPEQFHHEHT